MLPTGSIYDAEDGVVVVDSTVVVVSGMGFSGLKCKRCKRLCLFRTVLVLPSGEESQLEHNKLRTEQTPKSEKSRSSKKGKATH